MYEASLGFPEGWGGVRKKIPSVGEVWIFSGTTQCLPAQSCVDIFYINSTRVNYPGMILKYILCCEQSHGK